MAPDLKTVLLNQLELDVLGIIIAQDVLLCDGTPAAKLFILTSISEYRSKAETLKAKIEALP